VKSIKFCNLPRRVRVMQLPHVSCLTMHSWRNKGMGQVGGLDTWAQAVRAHQHTLQ